MIKDPKRRTQISFAIFLVCAIALVAIWTAVERSDFSDDTRVPFRQALELNGRIWKTLFSLKSTSTCTPPVTGKAPRVNGQIGLESPLDLAHWKLEVLSDDQVDNPIKTEVSLEQLYALPKTDSTTTFKCIEGWSEDISYAGVKFSDFVQAYHLQPKTYVGLVTEDGEYYVSIDIESMLHPQTLLVYEMNGAPLKLENGAPLRLIIPVKYGIKNIKRISKIFFSDVRPPDYWMERGYDWYAGL